MLKRTFTQGRYLWFMCLLMLCTASLTAQITVTIPSANTNGTGSNAESARKPYGSYYGFERSAMIYTAAEVGTAGTISTIAFYLNSVSSPVNTPVKIYLKERATNAFSATRVTYPSEVAGAKLVYTGTVTAAEAVAGAWLVKTLDSTFYYGGAQNLEVLVETNAGGAGTGEATVSKSFRYSPSSTPNYRFHWWQADNNPPTGSTGTNVALSYYRPNVQFTITPPPACTGAPVAGTLAASPSAVCAGQSSTLSISGTSLLTGLSYSWLASTDGGTTYSVVNGANGNNYTGTINVPTYFRAVVTCTDSAVSDTTVALLVDTNFLNCHCIPAASNCGLSDRIDSVSIAGINQASTGCSTNGYAAFSSPVGSANKFAVVPVSVLVGPGGTEHVSVWIDYNHNGAFDANEHTYIGSGNGVVVTGSITIPGFALQGLTRLRVRSNFDAALLPTNGCTTVSFGETVDYFINILPAPPCTGTPTAGNTIATSNPACVGQSVTLSTSGTNNVENITYEWLTSTDGVTYTTVNGANSSIYTFTYATGTYYKAVLTCTNGGNPDTSAAVQITTAPFTDCYCIPGASACGSSDRIDSVNFAGIVSPSASGCSPNGYVSYSTPVGSALKGSTYPISVKVGPGGTEYVGVWIDYNHNSVFDSSEYKYIGTGNGVVITNSITIPSTALSGITKMRVRVRFSTNHTANDACLTYATGETEDYLIDIQTPPACTTAVAGTTASTGNNICASVPFTLSISGSNNFDGISYQWISSTDGINYTPVNGANGSTLTTTQNVSTYYRNIVSCSFTSTGDTSTALLVTTSPFDQCYCTPTALGCTQGDRIDSVSYAGINNASGCSTNGYNFYTTPTGTAYKSFTSPITLRIGPGGTEYAAAWIDYNHNGVFDTTEFTLIGTGSDGVNEFFINGTITIPGTALTGPTRMRIRVNYNATITNTQACAASSSFGEVEDYIINIIDLPACTNPPVAGTVAGDSTACAGATTTLVASNYTLGTALQWQTSTDSLNWTDVPNATSASYTVPAFTSAVYYRLKVTCVDSVFTAVFPVRAAALYECPCLVTNDCTDGDAITNVTFGGINNLNGINNNSGCSANGYSYYSSPVDTFYQSTSENLSVTVADNFWGEEAVVAWIDFDQSGTFDAGEYFDLGIGYDETLTTQVDIPANAATGFTLLRVRQSYVDPYGSGDACLDDEGYGETEDYVIYIAPLPACSIPVVAGVVSGPSTSEIDSTELFVLTGYTGNIQWQYSNTTAAGPYLDFTGSTNDSINVTFQGGDTFYIRAIVRSLGCDPDSTTPLQVIVAKRPGDDVCDALPLTFGINGPYNTSGASVQAGEVAPPNTGCAVQTGWCNSTLNATLWFKFTAPASGRVRIYSPATGSGDTQLALWDAAACDSLLSSNATLVRANDDDPAYTAHGVPQNTSYIDSAICLTPGKTYWVQLDQYSSSALTTTIVLTDLGPGPVAQFTNLDSTYCINAAPVTLTPTGGTFTGTGITGNTFNPATAGVGGPYVITRSFYACYTFSDTVYAVNAAPTLTVDGTTDVLCHSGTTGSVAVTTTGGTLPYVFAWSNNAVSEDLTAVAAGTYNVTVNDANLCSATGTATVMQPDTLLPALDSLLNVSCPGDSNGAIYITTQGGVTPYTFAWSNGDNTEDLVGVPSGLYSLTVTDANGCTYVSPQIPISQPAPIAIITNSTTNVSCNGGTNGAINITVTGGTPGYTYLWNNTATTQDLTGLTAGTYTPTVTDSKGCVFVGQTYTITQPSAIVVTVDSTDAATCATAANGAVYVTVTGGVTPYMFAWSNTTGNEDLTGVVAGSYTLTVTDASQCSATAQATVGANAAVLGTVDSVKNVTCAGGNTGAVYITATGGTTPYSYTWSNSTVNEDLTNAAAGSYNVIINDANGCSVTVTATVVDGYALNATVDSVTNVVCNGGNTGAVYITPTNGVGPYVYTWSNSANTQDITGLAAGVYSLTLADANGCTYNGLSATVTPGASIIITSVVTDQTGTTNNGAINVTISGGTSPYTSVWSNSANTEDLTAIAAGVYTTTVTDANGCTATKTDTVDLITGITLAEGTYSINMFPNPTAGVAHIVVKLDVANDVTVEVYNVAGQIVESVKEYSVTDTKINLDLTQHAAGIYNTKITIGDKVITKRLIVNK